MKALDPQLTPARIQALLRQTSTPVRFPGVQGAGMPFGVLDLEAALRAVDAHEAPARLAPAAGGA